MIDEVLTGPADSDVLQVARRYSGGITASGAFSVQLQRKLVGHTTWGVVATYADTDDTTQFDGEHFVGGSREVEYRYRVVSGSNVHVWLAAPG